MRSGGLVERSPHRTASRAPGTPRDPHSLTVSNHGKRKAIACLNQHLSSLLLGKKVFASKAHLLLSYHTKESQSSTRLIAPLRSHRKQSTYHTIQKKPQRGRVEQRTATIIDYTTNHNISTTTNQATTTTTTTKMEAGRPKPMMMTSTLTSSSGTQYFTDPKYLTAAALAYAVVQNSQRDPHRTAHWNHHHGGQDGDDAIPELDVPFWNAEKLIKPVVVKPLTTPATSANSSSGTTTTTTAVGVKKKPKARASAAALRQLQSRRRVLDRMAQYNHSKEQQSSTVVVDPTAVKVKSLTSGTAPPVTPSPDKNNNTHGTTANVTKTTKTTAAAASSSLSLVRFKVKSQSTGTILRFQCLPTFEQVKQNITERLGTTTTKNSNTTSQKLSSLWSSASSMLSSNNNNTTDDVTLQFQDAEGDYITMSTDDDVRDAMDASVARGDTMVRLRVQEGSSSTTSASRVVWKKWSNSWGW